MKNLLKELRDHKIHIALHEGNLKLQFDGAQPSPALIAKIKAHKQQLIDYLEQGNHQQCKTIEIPSIEVSKDGYPLSSAQNRLWVLSQFEEGLPAYNITHQVELNGDYDIELFKKAVFAVVERHEILRTVFRKNEAGEIRQFVRSAEAINFQIQYKDFRKEENQNEAVYAYLTEDKYRVFDLENGPLLSTALLQLSESDYVFHYNIHHIIGDGWSMGVLAKDVLAFYKSHQSGETVPALRIQYKDYAAWQAGRIENQELVAHGDYWLKQLSGNLPVLNLPSNLQRPSLKTSKGQKLETFLSKELTTKLHAFTAENKGSLFTTLLAFWNILLYRYTGQCDLIIGSPVAGREHLDLENQIGFYVNTIALRNTVDPTQSIKAYYEASKNKTLTDLSHQVYPFDLLVDQLNLSRDTSRSAVFDMMLALQNTGVKEGELTIDIEPGKIYELGKSMTKFDIEVNFTEVGSMLMFNLNFNTDVYEVEMMKQFMRHFSQLLEESIANPDVLIQDIELLSDKEQAAHVAQYNYTEVSYPETKTIIDLFNEKVTAYPDRIAVTYQDKSLTYRTLDEVSNQLAHFLQSKNEIAPDDLIGLVLDRSEWMIISILAILKTGAAYVPIDKSYPEERINYMLEDSNCRLFLDERILEQFIQQQEHFSKAAIPNNLQASNLAYVIYTSGTTGKPKGTLLEHRNVVRLLFNEQARFDFNEQDVWCLFHSYCFDFSVWEIFGAILFGGKLVVVSKETTRDTPGFAKLLVDEGVTVLNQTPTAFKVLQEEVLKANTKPPVRYLVFGGEALNLSILKNWKQAFPDGKMINMYGITETTVHVTYKEITEADLTATASNIGVPIPTLGAVILDENQKIVPDGVMGELCVYGAGLARCYLNKPEITNERFIDVDIKSLGTTRVYRSGDFVKTLPNGELAYLGRMDKQVKIRGHRIELGEIETALLETENIQQCVVEPKENNGNKLLVAYFVSTPKQEVDKTTIQARLRKDLPEYMVPGFFVELEQLPLTTNGKINRKALPAITDGDLIKGEYVQPESEMEEAMISILKEKLGDRVSQIGVTDNFFDLGLDSLSLITILHQFNSKLNIDLQPLDLFQYPNVQSLINNVLQIETQEDKNLVGISDDMDSMMDIF